MKIKVIKNRLKIPRPRNNEELKIVTMAVLGVELTARVGSNNYEVHQSFDDNVFRKAANRIIPWEDCNPQYRMNELLFDTIFGGISCGGIARSSYGSVNHDSYRAKKRMTEFASGKPALSGVRPAFVRLAAQTNRERREQG